MIMKLNNGKDAKDGVEYVAGCVSEKLKRDIYLTVTSMDAGQYVFFIEVDWHPLAS